MMQPYMSANFVIVDSTSLFTLFPITGDEYIDIDIELPHPAFTKKIQQRYRVVGIEDVSPTQQVRNVKYILRAMLDEAFSDWTTKIRKAYVQTPVSKMVKSLTEQYLSLKEKKDADINYHVGGVQGSTKANGIIISDSLGDRTIVIPNFSPAEAMRFLCREGWSSNLPSNFVFFSNPDAYYFKTIEEFLDQKPTDKYFLTEKHFFPNGLASCPSPGILGPLNLPAMDMIYHPNKPFEFMKVNDYKFINIFSLEDHLRRGVFDAKLFIIDTTVSKFEKRTYNYNEDYDTFKRTDANKQKFIYQRSQLGKLRGDSHQRYIMTDYNTNTAAPDTKYLFLHFLAASVAMLDYVALEISIPGDPSRRSGDIIRIGFPEYSAFDETISEENAFLAGDYLITGINHIYSKANGKGYQCVMQCVKNSYNKKPEDAMKPLAVANLNTPNLHETL
jgi:hypothetical protein